MTKSGDLVPEPLKDGSDEQDLCAAILNPALLDSFDLAQEPDPELQTVLRSFAPTAPAETLRNRTARLEIDRRIVARCATEGFEGPTTKKLLLVAFEYANPVVGHLVGTGRIFHEVKRLGRPVKRQPGDEEWSPDDRAFLTERCVDAGVFHVFHKYGLKEGRWDPGRGTALTTYAVNACSLSFATVYPRWWRGRVLEAGFGDLVDLPESLQRDRREPDPAERVVNRLEAERLLREMPEPVRTALWLRAMDDTTQAEAAQYLNLSEKALEGRIGRARARLGLTRSDMAGGWSPRMTGLNPQLDDAQEGDCDR